MTQENIDRLRVSYEVLGRTGEWPDEGLLGPEFELHQDSFVDSAKVFHGPDAPREVIRTQQQAILEMSFAAERVLAAPGGEVVVLVRIRGHGRGSGAAVDREQAHVWSFAGERATTMKIYEVSAEGLRAVGLEQA